MNLILLKGNSKKVRSVMICHMNRTISEIFVRKIFKLRPQKYWKSLYFCAQVSQDLTAVKCCVKVL
jgi:hypothetical protein